MRNSLWRGSFVGITLATAGVLAPPLASTLAQAPVQTQTMSAVLSGQDREDPSPAPSPTLAPDGAPDVADPAAVAAVARRLNCPLCQGYNLQDCPLVVCSQMRELIAMQLASGATDAEIIADFVAQYGPHVLNEPPRSGFHLLAWLLPIAVLALAGGAAALRVARNGRLHSSGPDQRTSSHTAPHAVAAEDRPARASADARARVEELIDS